MTRCKCGKIVPGNGFDSDLCARCLLAAHLQDGEPLSADERDFLIENDVAVDRDFVNVGGGLWEYYFYH